METLYHSILGLPRSGKTTFLAAFWHLIDAGEVETKLTLDRLVGDNRYLNEIVEAWRRCEEVPRTPVAAETQVAIHVHEPATARKAVLEFPDLSGESFEEQFAGRSCTPGYLNGLSRNGGILLFINADRAQDGITHLDLAPVILGDSNPENPEDEREWSPSLVPEQVRLVDLLQFIQRAPFEIRRRRLAIGVSAWDVVSDPELTPSDWLARELPFLNQFLKANRESFDVRVYGISAQGGAVTGDSRERLARETPSRRIRCMGPDADLHDLTAPVVWLSGGD
ncbi:hypothetical protein [Sinorhizobium sp. BJ1]|uniref:TRAFAC clade GTPase domain-containing protein n=1 Tax=Sinorhizobium sp. BJ1 TaxID=2035455 RepID=UPI000BE8D93E|nr:hypothetical protein [Sinorhizobium sp. BJ1]PDT81355.1 hypothetical protein CO676_22810 [Sinorhizobium sp. BJ1]